MVENKALRQISVFLIIRYLLFCNHLIGNVSDVDIEMCQYFFAALNAAKASLALRILPAIAS